MLRAALLLLALAAPAAQAETYKWVDANGVVNYSNTPPPGGAAASAQTVPNRISSYAPAPEAVNAIEVYRRLDATQAEWMQRQQIMALQQQAQAAAPAVETMPAYYPAVPYYASRRPHLVRPVHFAPKPAVARPVQRASLNRL